MKNAIKFGWIALVSLVFSVACSGSPEDYGDEPESDIGQVEEAVSVGNGGYGFTNAASALRCAQPGSSGQVCFANAVNTKTVGYCFQGFPISDQNKLKDGFTVVDAQTNWTFLNVGFPCDISIFNGTVSGGVSSLENFMRATPTGTIKNLTSPAGVAHVNGSWQSFTKLSVVVDKAKLDGFAGAAYGNNWFQVGGAIAARYIGLGATSSGAPNSFTRRSFSGADVFGLTAGEVCRANNATFGNPNQINAVVQCPVN